MGIFLEIFKKTTLGFSFFPYLFIHIDGDELKYWNKHLMQDNPQYYK